MSQNKVLPQPSNKITAVEIDPEINTEFKDIDFQAGMHFDIDKTRLLREVIMAAETSENIYTLFFRKSVRRNKQRGL